MSLKKTQVDWLGSLKNKIIPDSCRLIGSVYVYLVFCKRQGCNVFVSHCGAFLMFCSPDCCRLSRPQGCGRPVIGASTSLRTGSRCQRVRDTVPSSDWILNVTWFRELCANLLKSFTVRDLLILAYIHVDMRFYMEIWPLIFFLTENSTWASHIG